MPHRGPSSPSMAAPSPGFRSIRRTPPHLLPRATMSQHRTVARRHHVLTALSQTLLAAPRPSPHMIIITTPWTMHIDVWHSLIPLAHSLQMTWWLMCPATSCLLPRESTSLHPLDCARSEGECCGSGSRPGPPDQDHAVCSTVCSALGSLGPLPDLLFG